MGIFDWSNWGKRESLDKVSRQIFKWINFSGDETQSYEDAQLFIEEGYKTNPHVYSVVELISNHIKTIPFKVVGPDGETEISNHVSDVLERPNSYQTWSEFLKLAIVYLEVTGNIFIYGVRMKSRDSQVTSLHIVPTYAVDIAKGTPSAPVAGYRISNRTSEGLIPVTDIIHIKKTNPTSDDSVPEFFGLSPLEPAKLIFQKSNAGYRRLNKLYKKGMPEYIVSAGSDTSVVDADSLTQADAGWSQRFGGGGQILFSSETLKIDKVGLDVNDLDSVKMSLADLKDICRIYNTPIQLLTLDDKGGLSSEDTKIFEKRFWKGTLIPKIDEIIENLNSFLIGSADRGKFSIKADYSKIEVLQDSNNNLRKSLIEGLKEGLYTPNQVLEMLGEETRKDGKGDEYRGSNKSNRGEPKGL